MSENLPAELGARECRTNPEKLLFQLIPPEAEAAIAAVLTYGSKSTLLVIGRRASPGLRPSAPSADT